MKTGKYWSALQQKYLKVKTDEKEQQDKKDEKVTVKGGDSYPQAKKMPSKAWKPKAPSAGVSPAPEKMPSPSSMPQPETDITLGLIDEPVVTEDDYETEVVMQVRIVESPKPSEDLPSLSPTLSDGALDGQPLSPTVVDSPPPDAQPADDSITPGEMQDIVNLIDNLKCFIDSKPHPGQYKPIDRPSLITAMFCYC